MYDFYGPTVPEINYSILFYNCNQLITLFIDIWQNHHCGELRSMHYMLQLRRSALPFFHSHSDATGVF